MHDNERILNALERIAAAVERIAWPPAVIEFPDPPLTDKEAKEIKERWLAKWKSHAR